MIVFGLVLLGFAAGTTFALLFFAGTHDVSQRRSAAPVSHVRLVPRADGNAHNEGNAA